MQIFDIIVSPAVIDYFNNNLKKITSFELANDTIVKDFGILQFFTNQEEFISCIEAIASPSNLAAEDRAEYGDFQTNLRLATEVARFVQEKGANPGIVIEPTCGKGNFILAALDTFKNVKKVIGIEIYKPYVWETKFSIIHYYLNNSTPNKPLIEIHHCNVFDFNFNILAKEYSKTELLVIGNPPWVTNAHLSTLESDNLPRKANFKNHAGFDAMTGKGNFDISEYITLMIFNAFQQTSGNVALLVKNAVIKSLLIQQKQHKYQISSFAKLNIDSKKEFDVSVEAALLYCTLNTPAAFTCTEHNFYQPKSIISYFGWVKDKFVSDVHTYANCSDMDGTCPFEWRQGVKHDLSAVMELVKQDAAWTNGMNETIELESDLLYAFLKSSDLKNSIIDSSRKYTIITQRSIGASTSYIAQQYPKTYAYLQQHKSLFDARKSSIYHGKPPFSIFGIGDYSFSPYKIAISGLYKKNTFCLILPEEGKPIMLDDTCYLLGFDNLDFAVYTFILLNAPETKSLLQAITFPDAKRMFTKEVLMRIDLYRISQKITYNYIKNQIFLLNNENKININDKSWNLYIKSINPIKATQQMSIFG